MKLSKKKPALSSCGVIFDVSNLGERDIELADIDTEKISAGDFVLFHTGAIDRQNFVYFSGIPCRVVAEF